MYKRRFVLPPDKNILAETRTQNPQIRSLVRFHCATKMN